MNSVYHRIDGGSFRKIWAVGDLHGCYTLLMNELDKISFDPARDLLISVGDLVDRGAENVECLELLQMPWFRAVRGNHEQLMLDALSSYGNVNHWIANGGGWFFQLDYDKEVLARALVHKVAELPLVIELAINDRKVVICHADYPHNQYEFDKPVPEKMVIWSRDRIGEAWDGVVTEIAGADLFVFGHTPARNPLKYSNQMYIDTGAVFCGNLTLLPLKE